MVETSNTDAVTAGAYRRLLRTAKAALANLRVEGIDRSVNLRAEDLVTLADLASIIEAEASAAERRGRDWADGSEGSKR